TAALFRVLPRALRTFRPRFPDVRIHLEEHATDAQLAPLREGSIDIGLLHPPLKDTTGLQTQVIERDRLLAAVPVSSALAQATSLTLADLAEQDFVLFPREQGPHLHDRITSACRRAGFAPHITLEPQRAHTILSLVGAGMGITLVGEGARSLRLAGVVFVPLGGLPEDFTWDLAIAWRARTTDPVIHAFLELAIG